jgi:HAD superfamily hydrolase (TIGR01484 family)
MIKLIAFDLDGTLAKVGRSILPEDLEKLKQLETMGFIICISSGKPTYYLCGFMRQVGLKKPILMGENGAAIQVGVELPPTQYYILPYPSSADAELKQVKEDIIKLCQEDIWLQPNLVGLTVFPKNSEQFTLIRNYLKRTEKDRTNTSVYEHIDSFDITPSGINKAVGLKHLCGILDLQPEEIAAVGDGQNDVPMFEIAGYSIGIATNSAIQTNIVYDTVSEALDHLLNIR